MTRDQVGMRDGGQEWGSSVAPLPAAPPVHFPPRLSRIVTCPGAEWAPRATPLPLRTYVNQWETFTTLVFSFPFHAPSSHYIVCLHSKSIFALYARLIGPIERKAKRKERTLLNANIKKRKKQIEKLNGINNRSQGKYPLVSTLR